MLKRGASELGLQAGVPRGWEFQLGLKDQVGAAPRGWTIFSEDSKSDEHGAEKIVTLLAMARQYQIERARHLAKYVRETLVHARDMEQSDGEV